MSRHTITFAALLCWSIAAGAEKFEQDNAGNGATLAKWLITVLAGLLAVYILLLWAKAEHATFWFRLWCGTVMAFAIWSIFLVQRRNA